MMMDNHIGINLKRKILEDFNNDFSDFPLSSPALKIRRLDAELPPIIEEEEVEIQLGDEQWMPETGISDRMNDELKPLEIEELPFVGENEERAIVVFEPMNTPGSSSSSNYSIDPNLISSFKNQAIFGSHLNAFTPNEYETMRTEYNTEGNTCKAVIPWVPSQQLDQMYSAHPASQTEMLEAMDDAEEPETSTMEIEDGTASNVGQQATEYMNHSRIDEALQQQWQQQHCMIPQPPQNTAAPIVWYR